MENKNLPKRIFALIPEKYILESNEFKATVHISSDSMLITVKDQSGKTMNGIQFIADLKQQDAADSNTAWIKREHQ